MFPTSAVPPYTYFCLCPPPPCTSPPPPPLGISGTMRQPQKSPGFVSLVPNLLLTFNHTDRVPPSSSPTPPPSQRELQTQETGGWLSPMSPLLILRQSQIAFLGLSSCLTHLLCRIPRPEMRPVPTPALGKASGDTDSLALFCSCQQGDVSLGKASGHVHGLQWTDSLLMVFCSYHGLIHYAGWWTVHRACSLQDKPMGRAMYAPTLPRPLPPTSHHLLEAGRNRFRDSQVTIRPRSP